MRTMQFFTRVCVLTSSLLLALYSTLIIRVFLVWAEKLNLEIFHFHEKIGDWGLFEKYGRGARKTPRYCIVKCLLEIKDTCVLKYVLFVLVYRN